MSITSKILKFNKSLKISTGSNNLNKYNKYKMNATFGGRYEVEYTQRLL